MKTVVTTIAIGCLMGLVACTQQADTPAAQEVVLNDNYSPSGHIPLCHGGVVVTSDPTGYTVSYAIKDVEIELYGVKTVQVTTLPPGKMPEGCDANGRWVPLPQACAPGVTHTWTPDAGLQRCP